MANKIKNNDYQVIRRNRLDGLSDVIEYYDWLDSMGHVFCESQRKQLQETADTIIVFGSVGKKWHDYAYELLKNNGK